MSKDLKDKTHKELVEIIRVLGQKEYLAGYIFSFIHAKNAADIKDITPLSKTVRDRLCSDGFFISKLNIVDELADTDGAVKFVFELPDGRRIESVLLADRGRQTVCVSCQAGCRMGCTFCATGQLKFGRDLTAGEIADQVNQIEQRYGRVANVVYMGMGEPMDNLEEVIRSVQILNDPKGRNIGQRHITISTCGITEGIEKLSESNMQVRLAVSLHSAKDNVRGRIMSIAKKYPLKKLLKSLRKYQQETRRRITFEYCMIQGLNDSKADAGLAADLIKGLKANINLIEYNPHKGCRFSASDRNNISNFAHILSDRGVNTTIRFKRGRKIKAACGQLGTTQL